MVHLGRLFIKCAIGAYIFCSGQGVVNMKRSIISSVIVFTVICSSVIGANWPAWRGPDMNGVCQQANPPITWSETENVKWKVKLAGDESDSTPVVWDEKLIFLEAVKTDKTGGAAPAEPANTGRRRFGGRKPTNVYKFNVVCLNRNTGKEIWTKTVAEALPHEGHHGDHGFASYSPITDGKHIWASFGSRGVYCLDMDGEIVWSKDLGKMQTRASFGEGSSPTIIDDKLIVVMDQEGDSIIAALNKKTGGIVWKKDRDEQTAWTTPFIVEVGGKKQIVVNGSNRIRSYDPANGDVIWQCGGQTQNVIPTPVSGFGMVYCTSGFRGSKLQAIKLGRTGELTGTDAVAWEVDEATPYVPSPILYGKKIYVCSGNNAIISCYNAKTGKPYYTKQKLDGLKGVYASPVAAAGRVYFTGRNGVVSVIKNSDTLEVLATNTLDDDIDCSPVVIGDTMYLKGKQYLYCISAKK